MNVRRLVSWCIHMMMGCVYLGVVGSALAGWNAIRDGILMSAFVVCSGGLMTLATVYVIARRRVSRREALRTPGPPSGPGRLLHRPLESRRLEPTSSATRPDRLKGAGINVVPDRERRRHHSPV
jgi:hypothetical protein